MIEREREQQREGDEFELRQRTAECAQHANCVCQLCLQRLKRANLREQLRKSALLSVLEMSLILGKQIELKRGKQITLSACFSD